MTELPRYGLAHKGGEDGEAYYTAYQHLPNECTEKIISGASRSAAISAIHVHARAEGVRRYIIGGFPDGSIYQDGVFVSAVRDAENANTPK